MPGVPVEIRQGLAILGGERRFEVACAFWRVAAVKAIETTGTVERERHLLLDESVPVAGSTRVRVIILLPEEDDPDEKEWLRAGASNPAFDFLRDSEEDVYTLTDGEPFRDQG
jgi:hypothetical protein